MRNMLIATGLAVLSVIPAAVQAEPNTRTVTVDRPNYGGSRTVTRDPETRTLSRDGRLVYAGLVETGGNPMILPSETRSIAEVTQAVALTSPNEPRLSMLRDGLIGLGAGDGWGSTNANAAALRALAASWTPPAGSVPVAVILGDQPQNATLDHDQPVQRWTADRAVSVLENRGQQPITALSDASYVRLGAGSAAPPVEHGLVLSRRLFRVQRRDRCSGKPARTGRSGRGRRVIEKPPNSSAKGRTHIALRLPLAAESNRW